MGFPELHRLLARILRSFGVAALALCAMLSASAASAQTADNADPPGRVGRLSYLSGPVQLIDIRTGADEDATLNWPVTSGIRLATGRLGRAEVRIGSLAVWLDDDSDVEFTRVDDEAIQITALHGSLALRVRNREMLRELDLLTPRERIVIEDIGRYRIDVDRAGETTSVTAFPGQARILSGRLIFTVPSGQRGDVDAAPVTSFRLSPALVDPFDDWVAARERRDEAPRSVQYVSPEMTGVEALEDQGTWRPVESYGPVWFPSYVPTGWVPYRYGRWAYIAPWGWTWIDDAPWGFAPFHYGRWVVIGGAWGWVPGVIVPRPVYAPALVAWFGSPGVSVSIGIGAPIGWFPLGPREVFIPPYHCSRRYVNFVNVPHVTNITNITVVNPPTHYVNRDRDRTTWVPGNALVNRGPIQRVVAPPPADWANRAPSVRPPVEPPRDIKKRPTPVPLPGRERPGDRTPPTAQQVMPPAAGGPAPSAPAVPRPGIDESRRRAPRTERPEVPAARAPAQGANAPAPTAPPQGPRVAPHDERRQATPPSEDATRMRQPAPTPQIRQLPTEPAPRAQERNHSSPRAIPQPAPQVAPAAPQTRQQPVEPAPRAQERNHGSPRAMPQPAPPAIPAAPQMAPQPQRGANQVRTHEARAAKEERPPAQPNHGNRGRD